MFLHEACKAYKEGRNNSDAISSLKKYFEEYKREKCTYMLNFLILCLYSKSDTVRDKKCKRFGKL
jgi:hypothetical protein